MAGQRLTKDYQQDVFAEDDYSSIINAAGAKQPTLQPPVDGPGIPYMISEAVGTLSGPAIYHRRIDPQAVRQGQATAHAMVHSIAPPTTATAACSRGPGSTTRPVAATSTRA